MNLGQAIEHGTNLVFYLGMVFVIFVALFYIRRRFIDCERKIESMLDVVSSVIQEMNSMKAISQHEANNLNDIRVVSSMLTPMTSDAVVDDLISVSDDEIDSDENDDDDESGSDDELNVEGGDNSSLESREDTALEQGKMNVMGDLAEEDIVISKLEHENTETVVDEEVNEEDGENEEEQSLRTIEINETMKLEEKESVERQYQKMTVKQLKEIAKSLGLSDINDKAKKQELISLLAN